jgi:hypothetical protein
MLELIHECRPSKKILAELATLDLSKLCDQMAVDEETHEDLHINITSQKHLGGVLTWLQVRIFCACRRNGSLFLFCLQTFDEPQLEVVAFWERQIAKIQECIHRLENGMDEAADGSQA